MHLSRLAGRKNELRQRKTLAAYKLYLFPSSVAT
jgi:hypothetical protein